MEKLEYSYVEYIGGCWLSPIVATLSLSSIDWLIKNLYRSVSLSSTHTLSTGLSFNYVTLCVCECTSVLQYTYLRNRLLRQHFSVPTRIAFVNKLRERAVVRTADWLVERKNNATDRVENYCKTSLSLSLCQPIMVSCLSAHIYI